MRRAESPILALVLTLATGCAFVTAQTGPAPESPALSRHCDQLLTTSIIDTVLATLLVVPSVGLIVDSKDDEGEPPLIAVGAVGLVTGLVLAVSAGYGYAAIGPCRQKSRMPPPTPEPTPVP